jgi:CRISP-associated protein Cas1
MDVQLNTLYLVTRKAVLRRDHLALRVEVDRVVKLSVPIHQLEAVAVFGGVYVTPPALALCAERGVAVNYLSESGRLLCRVDAPGSGNVLVRREQFRRADRAECRADISKAVIAGKLLNCRNVLLRAARETTVEADQHVLQLAASRLADTLPLLGQATDADSARGYEGDAARVYFGAFPAMIRHHRDQFGLQGRTRRPPTDPMNALLSFLYGLLLADCVSATAAAGLDPSVGFLHVDRPGRPGFALDLLEEFRPLLADRLALALVNRQQVKPEGFVSREGGGVYMDDGVPRRQRRGRIET